MTRPRRLIELAWSNLASSRSSALLSAGGVAVGIACLVFFLALGRGLTAVVRERIFPVDVRHLEVVPPQVSLSFLGGGTLDEAAVGRLRALPGVAAAFPKMTVRVPAVARYRGSFFGAPLHMALEVMAVGVDPAFVATDVAAGREFSDPGPGKPIPALAATRLLEIYNKSFAAQRNLPRLTPERLTGFTFPVELGRSFVTQSDGPAQDAQFTVVGFSDRAFLAGVTVPLETARRLNRAFGQDAERYSALVLEAARSEDVPAIAEAVRRAGFSIDDGERRLAEQVGTGVALVTLALSLLSALVTALAGVNIAHALFAAVRERRREIGVLRSVGATRGDIMALIVTEASIVGLVGGLCGVAAGWAAAAGADLAAASLLVGLPFKPESFFHFGVALPLGGVAVALAAAALGALAPARAAASLDPARAVTE